MVAMETKSILEAALLGADEPLSMNDLKRLFDESDGVAPADIKQALQALADDLSTRSVQLTEVASGWRIQTRPEYGVYLDRLSPEKAPKYSRAVMETLAIVAYRQPVTRGDIEEIRGVSVSSQIIKTLEERGWIDVIGHKEVIGRPALFGTTRQFLDDLGMQSLNDLPSIDDLAQNDEAIEMMGQKLVEVSPPPDASAADAGDGGELADTESTEHVEAPEHVDTTEQVSGSGSVDDAESGLPAANAQTDRRPDEQTMFSGSATDTVVTPGGDSDNNPSDKGPTV